MRIALDATYAADPNPTGVGIYSRRILYGLAEAYPEDLFLHCVRLRHFRHNLFRKPGLYPFANVRLRLLQPPLPIFGAQLFHALNQRVDRRPSHRVVTTFHDLFVLTAEYSTGEFRKRFANQALRAAANSDLIIAVSAFTAGQVSSLLGIEPARIRVIPHGTDLPSTPAPSGLREQVILTVGALQKRKNTLRLIEAFEGVPAEWKLVLAGSTTGYGAGEILDRIAQSPVRARIEVAGYVSPDQLRSLYRRASIFAFLSLDEGFGIPVLEAMASGVPVLSSNTSALPEVAGDAALLVNPNQTDEVASALRQLVQDEDLRADLACRGLLRAAQFPWSRAVRQTYDVYRELLGRA